MFYHEFIQINWECHELRQFEVTDERIGDDICDDKPGSNKAAQVQEGYSVTEAVLPLFCSVDSTVTKGAYLNLAQIRALLTDYVKKNVS